MGNKFRILVKYPTRSRPEAFLRILKDYHSKASDNSSIHYLVSYDNDDTTMTPEVLKLAHEIGDNITLVGGKSENKIHACNRDVNDFKGEWDIVMLISDDMVLQLPVWDSIVKYDMERYFPDTDGNLWYFDGGQKLISTLSIIGRKYYEESLNKEIYFSGYKSFFCDQEYSEVALAKAKMKYIDIMLAKHVHPAWDAAVPTDDLYLASNPNWPHDRELYYARKEKGFV